MVRMNQIRYLYKKGEKEYQVHCSFIQIYNEKFYDLLQKRKNKTPIEIREDKDNGFFLEGLSEYIVKSKVDCIKLLIRGERHRRIRATQYNDYSSRSHTIFHLRIQHKANNGQIY